MLIVVDTCFEWFPDSVSRRATQEAQKIFPAQFPIEKEESGTKVGDRYMCIMHDRYFQEKASFTNCFGKWPVPIAASAQTGQNCSPCNCT